MTKTTTMIACCLLLIACDRSDQPVEIAAATVPDIIATNAFYYYDDVETAWTFYRDSMGLETAADYGFAKIMRLAESSYLTLVQADSGMHSTAEPKTVTLGLVTDSLDDWYQHLVAAGVEMRVAIGPAAGEPASEFVAVDPEGYLLRFKRFNPHPNHRDYVAEFAAATPLPARSSGALNIRATVMSVYFEQLAEVQPFYEGLFGQPQIGTFAGAALYQMASSGFVALHEGSDDLHQPTVENAVTLSFLTTDIDAWFTRATGWAGFELRTPEILNEADLVRVFVGYDPTGIFLEWDTFLDLPDNAVLMRHLATE